MLYSLLRPLLFRLDPEQAHDGILHVARLAPFLGKLSGNPHHSRLHCKVGSLNWASPVGLAAGLDKNAEALSFFEHQGFGAIECGTLTLKPQLGNDKPRMFRYPLELSLRNAMGFPNRGLIDAVPRIVAHEKRVPLGINLGKNKESSASESIEELSLLSETLHEYADYFVINVSSPNTPGLRAFQEKNYLRDLFAVLNQGRTKDLYVKIAPDIDPSKVSELVQVASDAKLTGIIATNTTMMPERGMGGVSGELLRERSREIRRLILKEESPLELIGVGGFTYMSDVLDHWAMGGKSFQVYTAYVYQGPQLLKDLYQQILKFLDDQNMQTLQEFLDLSITEKKERITQRIP